MPRDARGFYRKLGYIERGEAMKKESGERLNKVVGIS
jgi:hypothetical protein